MILFGEIYRGFMQRRKNSSRKISIEEEAEYTACAELSMNFKLSYWKNILKNN